MTTKTTAHDRLPHRWRSTAIGLGAAALLAVAAVVVASVVGRAAARFAGTTSNRGSLFSSGVIEVSVATGAGATRVDDPAELAIDVENMVPATRIARCLTAVYAGSLDDVSIVLASRREGEPALDRYLRTTIATGRGTDPDCSDFVSDDVVYDGSLAELFDSAPVAGRGIELRTDVADGESITLRVELELDDDNAAQGLELSYWMTVEAVP